MRALGSMTAIMAIATATPVYAQDLCGALERIQTASHEPVMFASLEDQSELIPGYPSCRVVAGEDGFVNCSRSQNAPVEFEPATVAAQVSDCLGSEPTAVRGKTWEFSVSGLSFVIMGHCDERCQVGRSAQIIVRRDRNYGDKIPVTGAITPD